MYMYTYIYIYIYTYTPRRLPGRATPAAEPPPRPARPAADRLIVIQYNIC